jgi:carboxyl-terminal processing protease
VRLSFRRVAGILFLGLVVEAAFVLGMLLAPSILPASPLRLGNNSRVTLLDEAWDLAETSFFGPVPSETLRTYAAIRGMLSAYDDPYTVFVEPPQTHEQSQQLSGKTGGIGAIVRREPDGRNVLSPFSDGPAMKAGVQEGDALVKVGDEAVSSNTSLDTIAQLLRGEVGTQVTIEVQRQSARLTFTITRIEIDVPSVLSRILSQAPDIGYIAINIFAQPTNDELVKAIADLRKQGAQKLILDLRDNGGGLLDSAVDVAGQFVAGPVLIEVRRNAGNRDYEAQPNGAARDLPLAVLVNHGTASASEIVAGALQDHERGLLIGDQTFGKGSVQNILPLSDGSSLHVTVAQWLTPNQRQITGQGLKPDVVVGRTGEDMQAGRDPQLDKAIEVLK